MSTRLEPGTQVTWTIHGTGGTKTKTGQVVAFVPAGKRLTEVMPELRSLPKTRVKAGLPWGDTSGQDRYLVEVPRGGKSTLFDYYAPLAKWLEK